MIFRSFKPSLPLQSYIHQFYLMEGDFGQNTRDVFYADGCVEIVFNLGVDFYKDQQKEDWAKLIGQIVKPLEVTAKGNGKSFGIWFRPHGFSMFSDIPLKELTDRTISLHHIFPSRLIDFVGDCLSSNRIAELISALNEFFENSLHIHRKSEIAAFATYVLASSQDSQDLKALADQCNVSMRYLQRIFQETVGLSPKQFQKIERFQRTLQEIDTAQSRNLTQIGYDVGYYDQPHFIREFKSFTGFAPSEYTKNNHPLNQHYLG